MSKGATSVQPKTSFWSVSWCITVWYLLVSLTYFNLRCSLPKQSRDPACSAFWWLLFHVVFHDWRQFILRQRIPSIRGCERWLLFSKIQPWSLARGRTQSGCGRSTVFARSRCHISSNWFHVAIRVHVFPLLKVWQEAQWLPAVLRNKTAEHEQCQYHKG
jgi:hypothetical protein